jgi:small subunit ribosomal protein S7
MVLKKKKKSKDIVTKFVGCLTKKGKRGISQKIFSKTINIVCKSLKMKSGYLMKNIIRNLGVVVELRKVKIRRNNYLVPIPVNSARRNYITIKRILNAIKKNPLKTSLSYKLSKEFITIVRKKDSLSLNEKTEMLKEAYKNKSNMHFRW